jgi:hypothetical protein
MLAVILWAHKKTDAASGMSHDKIDRNYDKLHHMEINKLDELIQRVKDLDTRITNG